MNEDDKRGPRESLSEGIKHGLGVLSAFKDALEETIREAKDRGDLSPDRARAVMKDALYRAQEATGEVRERFDFVHQREFESLRAAVDELRVRLQNLERRAAQDAGVGPTTESPDMSAGVYSGGAGGAAGGGPGTGRPAGSPATGSPMSTPATGPVDPTWGGGSGGGGTGGASGL